MGVCYDYHSFDFNPGCYPVSWFIAWIVLAVGHRLRLMYVLRCVLLVFMAGSLSGAEYTPCGCDCNHTPTINTQEEEEYFSEVFIQYLIYYPEENNTTIIYKI